MRCARIFYFYCVFYTIERIQHLNSTDLLVSEVFFTLYVVLGVKEVLQSSKRILLTFLMNFDSASLPHVGQVAQAARRLIMGWTAWVQSRASEGWRFSCPDLPWGPFSPIK